MYPLFWSWKNHKAPGLHFNNLTGLTSSKFQILASYFLLSFLLVGRNRSSERNQLTFDGQPLSWLGWESSFGHVSRMGRFCFCGIQTLITQLKFHILLSHFLNMNERNGENITSIMKLYILKCIILHVYIQQCIIKQPGGHQPWNRTQSFSKCTRHENQLTTATSHVRLHAATRYQRHANYGLGDFRRDGIYGHVRIWGQFRRNVPLSE